jgi:hypothetical protein
LRVECDSRRQIALPKTKTQILKINEPNGKPVEPIPDQELQPWPGLKTQGQAQSKLQSCLGGCAEICEVPLRRKRARWRTANESSFQRRGTPVELVNPARK